MAGHLLAKMVIDEFFRQLSEEGTVSEAQNGYLEALDEVECCLQ